MTNWHPTIQRLGRELELVNNDLLDSVEDIHYRPYLFEQTWPSTALGFPGMGGSAMTKAWTIVMLPTAPDIPALVYFGGQFAYEADMNEEFQRDLANGRLENVMNSGKYRIKKEVRQ